MLDNNQKSWPFKQRKIYVQIRETLEDSLFVMEKNIVRTLEASMMNTDSVTEYQPAIGFDLQKFEAINKSIKADINSINEVLTDETNNSYFEIRSIIDFFEFKILVWCILLLVVATIISVLIYNSFVKPILYVKNELRDMSEGILNEKEAYFRKDEIGEMIKVLGNLTTSLLKTKAFAKEISKGNYHAQFKPLSAKDELGNSLIDLRDNLEQAINETNDRREKEQIQNWTTQGLAKFADILRQNNDNFETLGKHILRNLVEYMNINQGGIFVYYDQDKQNPYLDLIAVYAYNRDKYMKKRIIPGEGLVGACFVEKHTMYMTEIPNNYLSITSGLGKANPRSILIVPLKIEEKILGVLELASFKPFEQHEINFVERIGESIAATIQTVRTSEETNRLLNSITQQTEAMKAQEEEMRQNMEELLATQEEAQRREQELVIALQQAQDEISALKSTQ